MSLNIYKQQLLRILSHPHCIHFLHIYNRWLDTWQFPFYITHIQAHIILPGPLTEGNTQADALLFPAFTEASAFHDLTHCNSKYLKTKFHITWAQAKQIVSTYPTCQMVAITMSPTETGEINPRGLRPSHIWQMDVTHLLENLLMYMSQLILTLNLSGQLLALENLQDMLFHICVAALLLWASHKI